MGEMRVSGRKKRAFLLPPHRRPSGQKKPSQTKPARLRSCLSQTGAERLWHRSRERKTFVLTSYVALHLAKTEKPAFYLVSRKLTSVREMFFPLHPLFSCFCLGKLPFFFLSPLSLQHTHYYNTKLSIGGCLDPFLFPS